MKKSCFILLITMLFTAFAHGQVSLDGRVYEVDTIMRRQVGPGIVHTRVRLPEYPMNAYVLEVDMQNGNNRVETNQAYNRLGKTETLANAYKRQKSAGKKPIAGCNGAFWCVTANTPYKDWMLGSAFGGEVVNDTIFLNTNTSADSWNGGPSRTSATIIDVNNRVHIGPHQWFGYVSSSKFSSRQEVIQVNKRVAVGQLALFNKAVGRDHKFYAVANCNYVFLNLKAGERWQTAKDVKFEVADVKIDANDQVLGEYDACLVGDGAYKAELAKLSAGDEVTFNNYWMALKEDDKTPVQVSNMVEGNAWVMLHGQLTERNTDEGYNSMTYSRCAYGNNADGTKLYMIVIDMSNHPLYGRSVGCSTTVMCNLLKFLCPDVWNVSNNDAGGSAQMMVDGSVINKTTEVNPRAVANGLMLFSIAPEEDADVVTKIAFDDVNVSSPIYYTIAPKVLGYNKYGELIVDGLEGVTYTCSENVGKPSADGSKIEVGGNFGYGTITAHYGDAEVTAPIEVRNLDFSMRIKPLILLDTYRSYPIEITTEMNGETLKYDAARFDWTVEDASVAEIKDGVLRGLKEGTTKIIGALGGKTYENTVKVEVAPQPQMMQGWDGWTVKSANLSADATLSADGKIDYSYGGKRRATITLTKDVTFYSLPDSVVLDLSTSTRLTYVEADVRSLMNNAENVIRFNVDPVEAGHYRYDILDYLADRADLVNFPMTLKSIKYGVHPGAGYVSGANTITQRLYAAYQHPTSGIGAVGADDSEVSVYSDGNGTIYVSAQAADDVNLCIFDLSGKIVKNLHLQMAGGVASFSPQLAPGVYVVKAVGRGAAKVVKMVIK